MSRLRGIFVQGNSAILQGALEDVLFLSAASQATRMQLLRQLHLPYEQSRQPLDKNATPQVPELFTALARRISNSRNVHYQQCIIVQYMLLDSELFGRFMLLNEPEQLQQQFMCALQDSHNHFISGHHSDGSVFRAGDNLNLRRAGAFITRVRELFAVL